MCVYLLPLLYTSAEYYLTFVHAATAEEEASKLFHLELFENNRQFCISTATAQKKKNFARRGKMEGYDAFCLLLFALKKKNKEGRKVGNCISYF